MLRVGVVGAGIKGASLAALLSMDPGVHVTVFEAGSGPSGATLTNHGRLHVGSAGFDADTAALMARRQQGSRLWRQFGIGADARPAVYVFDDRATFDLFDEKCAEAGIRWREARELPHAWVDEPLVAVELPEYGFNPARLTARLRRTAEASGATWRTGTSVHQVDWTGSAVEVRLSSGTDRLDVVVNCAARWAPSVELGWREQPLFEVDWAIWQIMAAPAAELPDLSQVVVKALPTGQHASVVPHGAHVTLDFKSASSPEPRTPAPGPPPHLRPVQRGDRYLEQCIQAFPALADAKNVVSFDGVQGRIRGATPGSVNTLFFDPAARGYLIAQGGQASTALMDSLEVVDHLWSSGYLDCDPVALFGSLLRSGPERGDDPGPSMAWEST